MRDALLTAPNLGAWANAARELVWLVPLLVGCGLFGGFLRIGLTDDLAGLLLLALIAIVAPALGEELLFRALLLPRPEEQASSGALIASVAAFVLWHPFQALVYGPDRVPIFLEPWFLVAVAGLGIALARLYRATGSIWPCVAMHWLIVVGWKAFLGGPPVPFA